MDSDLEPFKAALGRLDSEQLLALIMAASSAPQIAPGFLAWLEAACDWELHRREGTDYEMRRPEVAIPKEEDAFSIEATAALRGVFWSDAPEIAALFDELANLCNGDKRTR